MLTDLQCAICQEGLKDPRSLPCLHSFCLACLSKYAADKKECRCPICRSPFEISQEDGGVVSLPVNYVVASRIAASKAHSLQDPNNVRCEVCDEYEKDEASYFCQICGQFLCQNCHRAHKRFRVSKDHYTETIDEHFQGGSGKRKETSREPFCTEHPELTLNTYCVDCEIPLCPSCAVSVHTGHHFAELKKAVPEICQEIRTEFQEVKRKREGVETLLRSVNSSLETMKLRGEEEKEGVRRTIKDIKERLDAEEAKLIGRVEDALGQKEKEIKFKAEELQFTLRGIIDAEAMAEEIIAGGSGVEIAKSKKQLLCRADTLRKIFLDEHLIKKNWLSFDSAAAVKNFQEAAGKLSISLQTEAIDFPPSLIPKALCVDLNEIRDHPQELWSADRGRISIPGMQGMCNNFRGEIIVASSQGNCIQVLYQSGLPAYSVGYPRFGISYFNRPAGLAEDPLTGNILVADSGNHRIQIFNQNLVFLKSFGKKGKEDGQFACPYSLSFDKKGNIFVADSENHRIQVFDGEGKFLWKFGERGEDEGQLLFPRAVAFDPKGNLVISDHGNDRLSVFRQDGRFIKCLAKGMVDCPFYIAIDGEGKIFSRDCRGSPSLKVFSPNGELLKTIGVGHLKCPMGMYINPEGRLIVADSELNKIFMF